MYLKQINPEHSRSRISGTSADNRYGSHGFDLWKDRTKQSIFNLIILQVQIVSEFQGQIHIYNIRTLSVNTKFICRSFRNRQNSEPSASFSGLFRSEYK